jgi:hypothetical protein
MYHLRDTVTPTLYLHKLIAQRLNTGLMRPSISCAAFGHPVALPTCTYDLLRSQAITPVSKKLNRNPYLLVRIKVGVTVGVYSRGYSRGYTPNLIGVE